MEVPAWVYERGGEDVTIEAHAGTGAFGDVYGAPVVVRAVVDDKRRLVRDRNGDQVTASTMCVCPLSTVAPVDSRATVRGRATKVLASRTLDGHDLPVPSHVELMLE